MMPMILASCSHLHENEVPRCILMTLSVVGISLAGMVSRCSRVYAYARIQHGVSSTQLQNIE